MGKQTRTIIEQASFCVHTLLCSSTARRSSSLTVIYPDTDIAWLQFTQMGACYSECEESVTPNHLGEAARTYQQQHQTEPQIEPQQQQQIRQTIQDILNHPVTSDEVQQEAFKDGVDFFDMKLKRKSQELSPGFPPSRVERLSESSVADAINDEEEEKLKNDPGYEREFPSLSNSSLAVYAKRRLSVKNLPTPGSTDSTFACVL
ncbi:hypothetical protein ACTXT7_002504, partial [Hymenolepis weldensis]